MFEVDKEHVAMNVPKIKLKLNELGIESSHYKDLRKTLEGASGLQRQNQDRWQGRHTARLF